MNNNNYLQRIYPLNITLITIMVIMLFFTNNLFAQLTGTKTIPSANYPTIKAAVDSLNLYGVAGGGGVTFNVTAGYTETLTARLDMNATGSLADPIVFQKSGAGANPVITSYTGTNLAGTATPDGMWSLNGSDYVTIDGINLTEAAGNTTPTTTMEYGYGLFKASPTDGANNNTIKNCVITLNRNNTTTGGAPFFHGSIGIALAACSPTTGTAVTVVTTVSGASSNNKFYSNTIQNVNTGISMVGFAGTTPFTLCDFNNDIGGSSLSTGNSILNFGGGTTPANACAAVFHSNQWSANISYNTVNNNNGSGVNHAATNRGIFLFASSVGASATVTFNNVTIQGGTSTTAIDWGIDCEMAQSGAAGNTISINNNTMSMTKTTATAVAFTAIWINSAPTTFNCNNNTFTNFTTAGTGTADVSVIRSGLAGIGTLNINNNSFSGISFTAISGTNNIISVSANVTDNLNINGNNINGVSLAAATTKVLTAITLSVAPATLTSSISNNNFQNITRIGTGTTTFISAGGTPLNQTVSGNTFTNLSIASTGSVTFIAHSYTVPAGGLQTISGNSIVGSFNKTGAGGTVVCMTSGASTIANTLTSHTNNNFSNITVTGATILNGIANTDGLSTIASPKVITGNTFSNWTGGTSAVTVMSYTYFGSTTSSLSNNTITNITGQGAITAINIGASGNNANPLTISNNTINNISSTGTGGLVQGIVCSNTSPTININNNTINTLSSTSATSNLNGMQITGGFNVNVFKNKIYDIVNNGAITTQFVTGVFVSGAPTTVSVYNNIIGDLRAPIANNANALIGIAITATSGTLNVNYNTVRLAGTSSGALFGSSALFAATAPTLTLRNNILVNLSSFNGAGITAAYRRSTTTITTHSSSSNNNLFYAGVPGANNLIFNDGTNSDQTVMAYKARVFSADANSGSENPTFISTVGANANFLHIDPTVATNVESGAANISGIVDDFDAQTRQGNPGYIGTGTAPDIGADEFGGITAAALAAPINFTSNTNTVNSFNITWDDNSVGEAGFVVYRSLNIGGPFNTIVAAVSSTTSGTTGTTYTLPQTGLLGGTTYYYQVVANNFSSSAPLNGNATTLSCGGGLAGTYSVGPTGTYASLTAAITAMQASGLSAPVILELQSTYLSGVETFPITFSNLIGCLNPTNTLTIRPELGAPALTITSANATATIDINGANFVTIDGRPGGTGTSKMLIILNTLGTAPAIRLINEASNNTVKFCDVQSNNNNISSSANAGVVLVSTTTGGFGNDNNTFDNCDIHNITGGNPVVAFNASGTATTINQNNDANVVSNCNIYDYFDATNAYTGVNIQTGNNAWSILNNRFYQTTPRTVTGTGFNKDIFLNNLTGNTTGSGFIVTGNYIGGSNSAGTGFYVLSGTTAHQYAAIYCAVGVGTPTSVQNNTITNISYASGSTSAAAMSAITTNGGNVDIGTVTGNLIGAANTDASVSAAISYVNNSATTGGFIPIFAQNANSAALSTTNISNNTVAGIQLGSSTAANTNEFNGIGYNSGNVAITNNTIGSLTTPKSIYNTTTASTSNTNNSRFVGILISGATSCRNVTVSGNTISNMYTLYANPGAPATTGTRGILVIGALTGNISTTISNNTIKDLTTFAATTTGGAFAAAGGISVTATAMGICNISNNVIYNLNLAGTATTGAVQATGIFLGATASGLATVERNNIHSFGIAANNPSAFLTGMDIGSGTWTVRNNMIRLGIDGTGANITVPLTVRGITKNAASTNIWFNSIYIGGSGVDVTATNTFALVRTGAGTDDWRDNVLVNNRSNATTGGKHYALNLTSFTATLTLNYNDYLATGTGGVLLFNTADVPAYIPNWVTGDLQSYNSDPQFINPTGNATTGDLHINPSIASIVESTGINIASVTNDIDNQTRATLTPTDMGADAGNFINAICTGTPVGGSAVIVGSATPICISGTKTIAVTGATSLPGITYQWKSSLVSGGPYTAVIGGTGATSNTYTTATLSQTTYYACQVICSTGPDSSLSSEIAVIVNNPQVVSAPSVSRCGPGTVTLCATGSAGTTLSWYTTPTGGSPLIYPYSSIAVTGYNNDIVANGVGTGAALSMPGTSYPLIGIDGVGYTFIDNTYKWQASNALPTCNMPANNLAPSLLTPGLTYQLQSYTGNNALTIDNNSTTYVDNTFSNTGTFALTTPASYGTLKVLYESVVNVSPLTVDVVVTFADATTQTFSGISCVNWFSGTPALTNVARAQNVSPGLGSTCPTAPNLFEMTLALDAANYSKLVQSINFTIPTVLSAGAFPYNVNYFHAMAVAGNAPAPTSCYTTPIISTTTPYYVQASAGGTTASLGLPNRVGATTNTGYADIGLMFDAFNAFTLESVAMYPVGTGTTASITIQLKNSAGTTLQTTTVSVPTAASPGVKTTIPLNFAVPAGTQHRLVVTAASGLTGLIRESSTGYVYPYTLPSVASITSAYTGGASSAFYYYFYDWQVTTGCSSGRTLVNAIVTAAPTFSVTPANVVCNNAIAMLNVTSPSANYDSITWAPTTNLFKDAAATIPYTGGNEDTVYFRSATQSANTFTATANNTQAPFCGNTATTTVNVQPVSATVTSTAASLCFSGSVTLGLNPASPYAPGSIQWQVSADSITFTNIGGATNGTYTTPVIDTTTYYRAIIKNSNGDTCFYSDAMVVVNEPAILATTGASSCTPASLTLSATATSGATINWYANATGGISLGSGLTYTTPTISNSTTYYAAASNGGSSATTGMPAALSTATSGAGTTNFGLVFDALSAFTLNSVTVYPVSATSAAGTVTIDVINSAGTVLNTITANVVGSPAGTPVATVINCNFNIAAGTNLKMRPGFTGITGLLFEPSASAPGGNYGYPYVVPGILSINTSTLTAAPANTARNDLYYYFYNWNIATGCESARTPVVAAISTAPTSITTVTSPVVTCTPGQSVTLSVTGSNGVLAAGGSWEYQWMDETGTTVLQAWSGSSNFNVIAVSGLNKYRIYMRNTACPVDSGFDYASFVVGITGSAIGVSPTGCSPTGTIIVSATGSGVLTNWYSNDFTSPVLGAAAAVTGSATVTGGQCVITTNSVSQSGALQVFNPGAISAANYQIDFDLGVLPSGADGISYSFGDDVSPTATPPQFECGTGTKFKLTFDSYSNTGGNVPGMYLMYNCTVDLQPPTAPGVLSYINNTSWLNANTHVTIIIDAAGFVTVKLNGIPVMNNVQLPASYLTANRSTWTHVFKARTGGISEAHTVDNLVIKYNAFEYSINGPGGPWQASNAFGSLPVGSYSVWVRNPADITCTADLGIFVLDYPSTINTNVTDTALCISGTATLSMSPLLTGATFQWDSSAVSSSGPWFPITGATNATYLANISATSWYRCNISCGGTPIVGSPSVVRQILVNNPQVINPVPGTRCGIGTVNLSADSSAGATLKWYDSPSGGTSLATGNLFTTPVINTSTTYYVSATAGGGGTSSLGLPNRVGATTNSGYSDIGLMFDAIQPFTLQSVAVYPVGTGGNVTITVALKNSAGTTLQSTTMDIPTSASPGIKTLVPLNFLVPAGTQHRLVFTSATGGGITGFIRETSTGFAYPYTLPGVASITSAYTAGASATFYYYFYDWLISVGCESGRTPVLATVTAPPAIILSGNVAICEGNNTTISVTSPSNDPNYTYTWQPGGFVGASYNVSPIVTTKYTVTATDNTGGTNSGCVKIDSLTVTVNPAPTINVTASNSLLCFGDSTQLNSGANSNTQTSGSLTTPLAVGNSSSACGFDITNTSANPVTIHYLSFTSTATSGSNISESVYYSTTPLNCTAPANVTTAPGWTLLGTASCTSAGTAPNLTLIPLDLNITIPPGATYAFAFGGASVAYSGSGTTCIAAPIASDANIALKMGFGGTLTSTINFRSFNGKVDYTAGSNITLNNVWTPATGLSNPNVSNPKASPAATTTYTVTVTNALTGCTSSGSITVNVAPLLHPYLLPGDSVLCSNANAFDMVVLDSVNYPGGYPSGTTFNFYGAGAILYQSSTSNIFLNQQQSDAFYAEIILPSYVGGCTALSDTSVIDFGNAQAPQYLLTTDSVACYGESNGKAKVEITFGGTPNFRYQWYDSGQNNLLRDTTAASLSDSLQGLPAGMYVVVITDHQGATVSPYCSVIDSVFVGEPEAPLSVTENIANHVNVLCNEALTGVIDINVAGGTAPYSYNWNNGATTEDLPGIGAGTYSCSITDVRGCTTAITVTITEPTAIVVTGTVNQILCSGGSGSINLNVNGGIAPYTYNWSDGWLSSTNTNLLAGTYTVTVTDANGCTKSAIFIMDPAPSALSLTCSSTNITCRGAANGYGAVTVTGGITPYTYLWSNGNTANAISGLVPGDYTVTVTDLNGCTAVCGFTITQPNTLKISLSSTNPTSVLPSSGTITSTTVGGTPAYTYLWNDAVTTANRTGLPGGVYTVTVTDVLGCTVSKAVTLTYACSLSATNQLVQQASCFLNNGVMTVIPSGGTSYSYHWQTNPVQTTATGTGLAYGFNSYCLITDLTSGCSFMDTVIVPTRKGLKATMASPTYAGGANIRCNGESNGSINLTVTGTTGLVTYLWSNGATTEDLINLSAGVYTVTITNGGCVLTSFTTLTQPAVLSATASSTAASCGSSNGTATVTAVGGKGGYSYSWNTIPVKTTKTATGLSAGTYTVTVGDANGCTATAMVTVTSAAGLTVNGTPVNVSCNAGNNGSITLTVSGGAVPYTYLWSNGSTTKNQLAVSAGTYTVSVTSANGCTGSYSATITQPTAITATASSTPASCFGGTNGTATVVVNGGSPGYTYSWNSVPVKTTATATGLKKGTYACTITDTKGCVKIVTTTVTEPTSIVVSVSKTNVSIFGGNNGTATANVSGGVSPYSYAWSTAPVQTTQTATGLVVGTYTVVVTDINGCTKSASVTITQPTARLADGELETVNSIVYPNPSNGMVTVSFDQSIVARVNVSVYTLTGNQVFTKELEVKENATLFDLDLTGLAKGIYSIRYHTSDKQWIEKLVIQ